MLQQRVTLALAGIVQVADEIWQASRQAGMQAASCVALEVAASTMQASCMHIRAYIVFPLLVKGGQA